MKKIIGVLILLGALGFGAGIIQRIVYLPDILGLIPTSYLKFSGMSLLLAIALSLRELAFTAK